MCETNVRGNREVFQMRACRKQQSFYKKNNLKRVLMESCLKCISAITSFAQRLPVHTCFSKYVCKTVFESCVLASPRTQKQCAECLATRQLAVSKI